ncbi:MAG: 23S rRNA (pseudouridine(1915)-N(3))-methyltransferase RlmH [Saprospiraceae bacterium]
MRTEFWVTGKTAFPYLDEGIGIYEKRLKHYLKFQIQVFPDIKNARNLGADLLKQKECEQQLTRLDKDDYLVLLDERGKQITSIEFAEFFEKRMLQTQKRVIIVVGGAYGFSAAMYERAQLQLSLSKMTFSHQMIRLFVVEQIYRAMSILKGESYHNE